MHTFASPYGMQLVVLSSDMSLSQRYWPCWSEILEKCVLRETVTTLPCAAINMQIRLNASSSASITVGAAMSFSGDSNAGTLYRSGSTNAMKGKESAVTLTGLARCVGQICRACNRKSRIHEHSVDMLVSGCCKPDNVVDVIVGSVLITPVDHTKVWRRALLEVCSVRQHPIMHRRTENDDALTGVSPLSHQLSWSGVT